MSGGQQSSDQITQTSIKPFSKRKGQEAEAEERQAGCYITTLRIKEAWGSRTDKHIFLIKLPLIWTLGMFLVVLSCCFCGTLHKCRFLSVSRLSGHFSIIQLVVLKLLPAALLLRFSHTTLMNVIFHQQLYTFCPAMSSNQQNEMGHLVLEYAAAKEPDISCRSW